MIKSFLYICAMSFIFQSETLFIDSATDMEDKVKKIDLIINALLDLATNSAGKDDVSEYSLDDGQTKIRTQFRGMSSIVDAINDYEQLRQVYFNRLNGRVIQLRDSKSVIHGRGHNRR